MIRKKVDGAVLSHGMRSRWGSKKSGPDSSIGGGGQSPWIRGRGGSGGREC